MSESEDDGAFESADEGSEEEVSEVVQTQKSNDEPQLDRSQEPPATKDQHGDRSQEPPATTDQHGEPDLDDATATKATEGMNDTKDTKMANEIKGAGPPNEVSETAVPKADVTHGAKSDDDITDGDGADGDDIGSVNVVISDGREKNDVEDRTGSEKNITKKGATEHVDGVASSSSVTDRTPEEKKSNQINSSTSKNPKSVNTMQREDSHKEEHSEVNSADVPADNMNIKQTKQKRTSAVNEKSAPPKDESISREDRGMCAASVEREPCEKRLEEPSAASALDRLTGGQQQQAAGGWGWGSWGSSIISTATSSVSTFTNSVGEGFNSVLDTVESTIGAPNPEELVELQRAGRIKEPPEGSNGIKDHQSSSDEPDDDGADDLIPLVDPKAQEQENQGSQGQRDDQGHRDDQGGWFQNWDNITDMSKTLVTGGLDVLEVIGKKTFDVIAEGDGGIKSQIKKRKEKPNLSQVLREAAQERENEIEETVEVDENKTAHFGTLFDEYNGLVHLETLESVSSQCELNVESLLSNIPGEQLATLRDDLLAITKVFKDVEDESENDCDDVSEHEFVQIISEHIDSLAITLDCEKIVKVHKDITEWLKTCADEQDEGVQKDCKDIHYRAIDYLAEMTVCCVEIFHKIAQLIQLHPTTSLTTYRHKAQHIAGLQTTFSNEVDIITTKFSECLNTSADDSEDPDSVTPFITNVYLESTNSKSYTNDAVQLLLPVLQNTALQAVQDQALQDT